MIPGITVFNTVCNLERITTYATTTVWALFETAMIYTTKNTMGKRLIDNNNDNDNK